MTLARSVCKIQSDRVTANQKASVYLFRRDTVLILTRIWSCCYFATYVL
jgi:hypothetical protein